MNILRYLLCTMMLVPVGGIVYAQSTIEGRVSLPQSHTAPVVTKRYEIVSRGGIVAANPPIAVVYLEGSFPKPTVQPVSQMEQKDLLFVPPLLPVLVGTKVEFPNLDNTYHNIFSYSPAKRFDLGRYPLNERPIPSQVFDVAGMITLRCDIHEHMRGLILVLNTPYFTTSDTEGRFQLTNLPAGQFKLKAWISSKTTLEMPIELKTNSVLHVTFP
jgi:plastocyanin